MEHDNQQTAALVGGSRGPNRSLEEITQGYLNGANRRHWYIGEDKSARPQIQISFPPVSTLCSQCEEVEAFNLFGEQAVQVISLGREGHQVFSFTVQCQRCKDSVIVFLVNRIRQKIQLVGRSDFEQVQVPGFIPKRVRQFYSQTVIAFQSGQVLAALFMLRTTIEQYMRAETNSLEKRGEDLCDEYAQKLGQSVSGQVPSFKEIYSELSDALHRADADEKLFESEREKICLHFKGVDFFSRRNA